MSMTTTGSGISYEVQLAIYDLSRGMARQLSAQFLGPQHAIEIIPHTGILVYGREYFFGGGIQSEDPSMFRRNTGLFPIQVLTLGRTFISQREFETWCTRMMNTGQYNAAAYDLLTRNCNNFSHDAAIQGLRLSQGVPDWVLDIPRRFLSSPMGQLVRPLLQNMQLSNVVGAEAVNVAAAPSSAAAVSSSRTPSVANNPWATPPTPQQQQQPQQRPAPVTQPAATAVMPKPTKPKGTPLLDSFSKPLLSSDAKTAGLCIKKLLTVLENKFGEEGCPDKNDLEVFQDKLLRNERIDSSTTAAKDENNIQATLKCMEWIQTHCSSAVGPLATSPAARSMAWLCVANAVGSSIVSTESKGLVDEFAEIALRDLPIESQPKPEVRQAASALLYNVILWTQQQRESSQSTDNNDEVSDMNVSLLCAALEGIPDESDTTVQLRRLMIAGRILKPTGSISFNKAAATLVQDLGLVEALQVLSTKETKGDVGSQCQELAHELLAHICG